MVIQVRSREMCCGIIIIQLTKAFPRADLRETIKMVGPVVSVVPLKQKVVISVSFHNFCVKSP